MSLLKNVLMCTKNKTYSFGSVRNCQMVQSEYFFINFLIWKGALFLAIVSVILCLHTTRK